MKQLTIFISHPHVLDFLHSQAQVAEAAMDAGIATVLLLPRECVCDNNHGINPRTKRTRCAKCKTLYHCLRRTLHGGSVLFLSNFENNLDAETVQSFLDSHDKKRPEDLCFRGHNVGRFALYHAILKLKESHIDWENNRQFTSAFYATAHECCMSILCAERFFKHVKSDALLVYNYPYSLNRALCSVAQHQQITVFSMTNGLSLRHVWDTLILNRGSITTFFDACHRNWGKSGKNRILTPREVGHVVDHFEELFAGKKAHAYSSSLGSSSFSETIERVSSGGKRKLLLAATSSPDERVASEQSGLRPVSQGADLFDSQLEWLQFLIDRVKTRHDLGLIIRVHPREFPNKRGLIKSAHAFKLETLLATLPENVAVNWPDQQVSLYDLIPRVDLVLTCWSSAALEASAFGMPVVLPKNPVNLYSWVADAVSESEEDYWQDILKFVGQDWTMNRSIQTFRYLWMIQLGLSVWLKGTKSRSPTLSEYFCEVRRRVLEAMIKWFGFSNTEWSEIVRLQGLLFGKIVKRDTNIRGRRAIADILTQRPGLEPDFERLQILQSQQNSPAVPSAGDAEEAEARAVVTAIKAMLAKVKTKSNCPLGSKAQRMLESLSNPAAQ